eukprot:Nk52_evm1s2376 gene=Nk52_evmTU1s2376
MNYSDFLLMQDWLVPAYRFGVTKPPPLNSPGRGPTSSHSCSSSDYVSGSQSMSCSQTSDRSLTGLPTCAGIGKGSAANGNPAAQEREGGEEEEEEEEGEEGFDMGTCRGVKKVLEGKCRFLDTARLGRDPCGIGQEQILYFECRDLKNGRGCSRDETHFGLVDFLPVDLYIVSCQSSPRPVKKQKTGGTPGGGKSRMGNKKGDLLCMVVNEKRYCVWDTSLVQGMTVMQNSTGEGVLLCQFSVFRMQLQGPLEEIKRVASVVGSLSRVDVLTRRLPLASLVPPAQVGVGGVGGKGNAGASNPSWVQDFYKADELHRQWREGHARFAYYVKKLDEEAAATPGDDVFLNEKWVEYWRLLGLSVRLYSVNDRLELAVDKAMQSVGQAAEQAPFPTKPVKGAAQGRKIMKVPKRPTRVSDASDGGAGGANNQGGNEENIPCHQGEASNKKREHTHSYQQWKRAMGFMAELTLIKSFSNVR